MNDRFYEAVNAELAIQKRPADKLRDNYEWCVLLLEETGEVAAAINDDLPVSELIAELIQVATVAKAWHDALTGEEVH